MSDDHGNTYLTATQLNIGAAMAGMIETSSEIDFFKLNLTAGLTYALKLTASKLEGPWAPFNSLHAYLYQLSAPAGGSPSLIEQTLTSTTGATTWTLYTPEVSGEYYVKVDASANLTSSYTVSYDIADLTAPGIPNILSGAASATAPVDRLSLKGTAEANAYIVIYVDGSAYTGATADSTGNWTYTGYKYNLTSGSHQVIVQAKDAANNASTKSAAITVVIDTVSPGAPAWDAGLTSRAVSTSTLALSGSAEAGAEIAIMNNSIVLGKATANTDGTWNITLSSLADGKYNFTATAKDFAGNISSASTALAIEVATTAPASPIITPIGEYVTTNYVSLTGTAAPGSTIQFTENGKTIATTTTFLNGQWYLTQHDVAEGSHTWQATAMDSAGNKSSATPLAFKVDTVYPAAPAVNPLPLVDDAYPGNRLVLSGTAEPSSTIKLTAPLSDLTSDSLTSVTIGTAVTDASGAWQVRSDLLANGYYGVMVSATDQAGHESLSNYLFLKLNSSDNIVGSAQADVIPIASGSHAINGGAGIDTVSFTVPHAGTKLSTYANSGLLVTSADGASTQLLLKVERLQFADKSIAIDVGAGMNGGMVYRLYQAAFDRTPDGAGVGYWLKQVDSGTTIRDVADSFLRSAEFAKLMGSANPDNKQFLSKLYANILHRTPDQAGYDYWLNVLDKGADRAEVLAGFSEGTENQAQVIGSIKMGFDYIPFG